VRMQVSIEFPQRLPLAPTKNRAQEQARFDLNVHSNVGKLLSGQSNLR
jgi:hypothetical protein